MDIPILILKEEITTIDLDKQKLLADPSLPTHDRQVVQELLEAFKAAWAGTYPIH